MSKRNAARTLCLAVLGGMLFLAGCTSGVSVKVMPYVGVSLYPPKDPASVAVLQDDPLRPHKTLGHVIVEPEHTLSIEETEQILRDAAASMGPDAWSLWRIWPCRRVRIDDRRPAVV